MGGGLDVDLGYMCSRTTVSAVGRWRERNSLYRAHLSLLTRQLYEKPLLILCIVLRRKMDKSKQETVEFKGRDLYLFKFHCPYNFFIIAAIRSRYI